MRNVDQTQPQKNVLCRPNMVTKGWVCDGTFREMKNEKPSPEWLLFLDIENEK